MRLWVKIVLLNNIIVITLGILIGLGIREGVTYSLRQEIIRQGELIAKNLSTLVADYILLNDHYKVEEAIKEILKAEADIEYIFVTDKDGLIFAHTFKDGYPPDILSWNPLDDKRMAAQLLETEKGYIRDIGIKVFEDMASEIHIGIREERIAISLKMLNCFLIIITLIMMAISSILSCLLSGIITKPLKRLVSFAHDLARGEFGKKVHFKTGDETGELAETFNYLSLELKRYREHMEESYRQMLRTEKLTALGRLSAGLAHELKNPLTSIRTLFQTFKNRPALITKDDVEMVISASDQMNDLLTKFLRFARSDEFNLTDVYINSIIKHVIKLVEFQLKDRSITLSLKLFRLPPVKADRAMIQQAILNLVLNAIEAMPQGGTLTISSRTEQGYAVVSISDTGTGIPEEIKDRIFDPFFTTKADGTGLGLSIVYNIINIHNGEINFLSNGTGTTFTMKIPVSL